jgi:putative flippase GtrA
VIAQFASREFAKFLLTGGIAATVNFGSRFLYSNWLDFSQAVVLAYLTGMAVAFVLARSFVFPRRSRSTTRSALIFVVVNIAAIVQTWAVSVALAAHVLPLLGLADNAEPIAHAIGIAVPVLTSYLGHKRWTFSG